MKIEARRCMRWSTSERSARTPRWRPLKARLSRRGGSTSEATGQESAPSKPTRASSTPGGDLPTTSDVTNRLPHSAELLTGRVAEYGALLDALAERPGLLVVTSDPSSGTSPMLQSALDDLEQPAIRVDARRCRNALDLAMALRIARSVHLPLRPSHGEQAQRLHPTQPGYGSREHSAHVAWTPRICASASARVRADSARQSRFWQ